MSFSVQRVLLLTVVNRRVDRRAGVGAGDRSAA